MTSLPSLPAASDGAQLPARPGLRRASALNLASQLVAAGASVVTTSLVARLLGPEDAGLYSYLLWLITVLATLATLGLPGSITRFCAALAAEGRNQEVARLVWRSLQTAFAVGVGVAALVVGWVSAFGAPSRFGGPALVAVAVGLPLTAAVSCASASLAGLQRYRTLLFTNAVTAPALGTLLVLAYLLIGSVGSLVAASVAVVALQLAVLLRGLRSALPRTSRAIPAATTSAMRGYLASASIIVVLDAVVWQKSEVFFLLRYSTPTEVAYYSLAFSLVTRIVALGPGAISGVLLPHFTSLATMPSGDDLARAYATVARFTAMATAPLIIGGLVLADPAIAVLFGSDYAPTALVLRILLVSGGLGATMAAPAAALYALGLHRFILRTVAVVAVVNVALDLVLIPAHGAAGAAVANGAAQLLGHIVGLRFVRSRAGLRLPWAAMGRVTACAALAAPVPILVVRASAAPVVSLAGGGVLYLGAFLALLLATRTATYAELRHVPGAGPGRP